MAAALPAQLATDTGRIAPGFARHETFHPRYGWLRKAYSAAAEPAAFLSDDATTRLGVGKNMVRAIRYWGLAYKVIEEFPAPENTRVHHVRPTSLGDQLFGGKGWDPYLEEPGSLWLLHWLLLSQRPECRAPSWWAIFNSPRLTQFNDAALFAELRRFCEEHPQSFGSIVDASLLKDARCLLRMYGRVSQGRDVAEDSIDSPFAELDLIRPLPGSSREFTLHRGPKRSLPDEILAWACLDFQGSRDGATRVVSLDTLTRAPGSPGRAFALTEAALSDALARFSARRGAPLSMTDAAGIKQVVGPAKKEISREMDALLTRFYGKHTA